MVQSVKEKLIRRAYFDLIGLPPTPEQVDAFVKDDSAQAFEKVVDSLLQSEHYGERWGRHWLDVVRFAESGGYEFDGFRPGAYHYRDWVIKALNADLPYNEFVRMQLAGDKLQPGYVGASATGFLVAGPYPGQITAKTVERIRYDQLDDMLMTVGGSMLGLTLGCVRCHDHKYDPLPQQDYYALAATLATTVAWTSEPGSRSRRQRSGPSINMPATMKPVWPPGENSPRRNCPPRFTKWQQEAFPKLEIEPRWQILDALSVTSEDTWLSTADDGVVQVRRAAAQRCGQIHRHGQTFQQKLTSIRLDALTHKSLPKKGPGLSGDGSFQSVISKSRRNRSIRRVRISSGRLEAQADLRRI